MKKRDAILKEGFRLFAHNGYDNTSTAMICEAVGVKKPTLYYYFKSKEDLYLAIVNEFLQGNEANVFDLMVEKKKYKATLKSYGVEFIKNLKSNKNLSNFIIELYIQAKRTGFLSDQVHGMTNSFKDEIQKIVELGATYGFFKKDETSNLCEMILTVIHGIEFSVVFGSELDHEKVWNDMVEKIFQN